MIDLLEISREASGALGIPAHRIAAYLAQGFTPGLDLSSELEIPDDWTPDEVVKVFAWKWGIEGDHERDHQVCAKMLEELKRLRMLTDIHDERRRYESLLQGEQS